MKKILFIILFASVINGIAQNNDKAYNPITVKRTKLVNAHTLSDIINKETDSLVASIELSCIIKNELYTKKSGVDLEYLAKNIFPNIEKKSRIFIDVFRKGKPNDPITYALVLED
jgi:hypothetical protein